MPILMTVVKIHTNELIPAIFERKGEQSILMWVSAFVKPVDGQSITEEQFTRLKGQFWVSMSQIHEDLPWSKWWHRTKYNVDEWLVGGAIPRSRVVDSVGKNLYQWDWDTKVWSKISEKRERTWCEKESSSGGNDGAEKRKRTWCEKEWSSGGNDGAYGQQQVYKKMRYNHMWKDTKKMTIMSKRPFDEMEAEEGEAEESEAEDSEAEDSEAEESEAETEISQELDGDENEEGQYEGAAGAMTGDRIE
ncbi:hypothetical protein SLS59_007810 [Nothophoma quercina]|uniref:Uncharacterized protein n=1 Tax=Nothophoma quercina TaxID=749835 RepID=A0ABR3QXN3_9PLEO